MDAIRKVLVIDDDPVVGKSFDRVLSGKGYIVIHASDGAEALNKLRDEAYDVVYTDIKMPGMNGLEVAERVKASQPWLPVVIITGYGTEANEARAKAAGVTGFLHKPLSPELIEGSAREALRDAAAAYLERAIAMPPEAAATTTVAEEAEPASPGRFVKNLALFLAAPFIGLAYMIAFPFIGLGMLAWMAGQALMNRGLPQKAVAGLKGTVMISVAPLLGLAYVVALPFFGLAMLAWVAARAILRNS
jgi:CheY-like chemotaxis protein